MFTFACSVYVLYVYFVSEFYWQLNVSAPAMIVYKLFWFLSDELPIV